MSKASPRTSSRGSNSSSSSRPLSAAFDFTAEGEVGEFGVNYVPGKGNVRWFSGTFDFESLPYDLQENVFRFLSVKELAICRQTCEHWSVIYEGAVSRIYADFCLRRKPEFGTVQEELKMIHRIRNLHKRNEVVQLMMWAAARNYHLFLISVLNKLETIPDEKRLYLDEIYVADGTTPLHVACRNNHVETIKLLLERGADLNATDIRGQTAGHGAVIKNAVTGLITLIQVAKDKNISFDLNRTSSSGRTMLYEASGRGYEQIVKVLLCAGGRRDDVLALEEKEKNDSLINGNSDDGNPDEKEDKLICKNGDVNGLNFDAVPTIIEKSKLPIDIEASTAAMGTLKKPELGTAMCAAACNGRINCLEILLQCNANVNALSTDKRSPLFLASEGGHLKCVRSILKFRPPNHENYEEEKIEAEKNNLKRMENNTVNMEKQFPFSVDIDLQGDSGKTPLFIAAENGHVAIANSLVNAGCAVSLPTSLNKTPLYMASEQGHTEIVRILLSRSSSDDVMKTTNYGTTALFIAQRHGHKAIATMITNFCSNHMKQAVQKASFHSNGAKVSAKFQKEYMAKLQRKYNTLEKERSLLVDAQKQVRGDKAQDLCDDISLVSRKLKQVEEEMRRKNSTRRINSKKEKSSKKFASRKSGGDMDTPSSNNSKNQKNGKHKKKGDVNSKTAIKSNLQMKSRRMRNAYAKMDTSVLSTKTEKRSSRNAIENSNDRRNSKNRKRLAELEKALKMEQDKIHLTQNNTNKSTVPYSDIDKTLDNIDKSKINKLKTSMPQNENDNSNTVVKRAAASLANADKILKRARSVEPPKSNPPEMEKRRPTSNGSSMRPSTIIDEQGLLDDDHGMAIGKLPTPRRSHERLREAQAWSKKSKVKDIPPPAPLSPPSKPMLSPSMSTKVLRQSPASTNMDDRLQNKSDPRVDNAKFGQKKEKYVHDAWSCLAGRSLSSIHRCLLRFSKSTSGFLISKPLLAYIYGASPVEVKAVFALLSPEAKIGNNVENDKNEEVKISNGNYDSIDAFECFVATSLLACGPLEDRLRFCFGLFDREGTNKLSKRHVGMLIRCCLTSVSKLHFRAPSIEYMNSVLSSDGVSNLVESAFKRASRKRSKKKNSGKNYDPDYISAKQFARWALDSKSPAPFVQGLIDLVEMVG